MKEVFLKELKLYLADHPERECVRKMPVRSGRWFPGKVKQGEIRLFADVYPPRSALFYKRQKDGRWIVIPLSDKSFTVPASNREALIVDRVYQFWNEIVLPASLAARSYLECVISVDEYKAVDAAYEHLSYGVPIPKGMPIAFGEPVLRKNDRRKRYFRRFQLKNHDFTYNPVLNAPWIVSDLPRSVILALPGRLAAADQDNNTPVFIVNRKGSPKERGIYSDDYRECQFVFPFTSFGCGIKPKTLKFKNIEPLPEKWGVSEGAFVSIHERQTRRQIGTGRISLSKNEIIIDDFSGLESLSAPIRSTADIVLVVSNPEKSK